MFQDNRPTKRIAIIGGGPSGMFIYKRLIERGRTDFTVDIFEEKNYLGAGMPYSAAGANTEHVTNVSGNEIPKLRSSVVEWVQTLSEEKLKQFDIDPAAFHDYKVLPRLLFGDYLSYQFDLLMKSGSQAGLMTNVHLNCTVKDISDVPDGNKVMIETAGGDVYNYDHVIICTGHTWPLIHEKTIKGYFDSPYPPAKLKGIFNHPVALRGSSLTAIDAIRTLARNNGMFQPAANNKLLYVPHEDASDFKIIMHSRSGLLPGIRFHLDDPHLSKSSLLSKEEIARHIKGNHGFLSLDFIFEKDFKASFKEKDPALYEVVKDMSIEEFVTTVMSMREQIEPFLLFKKEYAEASNSINQKKSIYWKEMLAILSFAMNYPAKHFSAEDMLRLQKVLMPLISIVIAFVPQSSCEELIALHDAGRLEIVSVGNVNEIDVQQENGIVYSYTDENSGTEYAASFKTFIDCTGQRHLSKQNFPFKSMVENNTITHARLKFRDSVTALQLQENGEKDIEKEEDGFYLAVPGIAIDDHFSVVDKSGNKNQRLYIMTVAYIGGFNPDYSGLDFCEEASQIIVDNIFSTKNA